ncbi:MAG: hypothetical protein IPL54_14030 [Chitinophagaceae bacterium]|nr:hypothetical protein [Chitinophagaceae bacterium]
MPKKQLLIAIAGIALVALLLIFGNTTAPKSKVQAPEAKAVKNFDIIQFIEEEKKTFISFSIDQS